MKRTYTILLTGLSLLSCASVSAAVLIGEGQASAIIVLPADAIPAEATAAEELRQHLEAMTGARLEIQREGGSVPAPSAVRILVGPSQAARSALPELDWGALSSDTVLLKTVNTETLVLAGGRPRGTLYAVYSFLEDHLGVRWWTSESSHVPKAATVSMPDLDITYTPPFWYRSAYYWQMRRIGPENEEVLERKRAFAARLRLNGHHSQQDERHGGRHAFASPGFHAGFVHTFYNLLPPADYYAEHPEWYSGDPARLREARGSVSNAQLCLTRPEVVRAITEKALSWLAAAPDADLISISQNDGTGGFCTCARCDSMAQSEGSQAGPLLHFVNAVAAEIERSHPDVLVETLAYTYSVKPPRHVRPRHNVIVRLCSYYADGSRPLDDERNAVYREQLASWQRIAPRLFVWNYYTNFPNQYLPHPNHGVFGPDVRFFQQCGVGGVFQQASKATSLGDFSKLKQWLQAHLLWDPSRDSEALIDAFLAGYYGAAAPFLKQYLDLAYGSVLESGVRLDCSNDDLSFIDQRFLEEGKRLFDAAEGAVRTNRALLLRVRRARVCFDYGRFVHEPVVLQREALIRGRAQRPETDLSESFSALLAALPGLDESRYYASASARRNAAMIQAFLRPEYLPASHPQGVEGKPFVDWYDAQEMSLSLNRFGTRSFVAEDAAASNGSAAWMPADSPVWAIQYHFPADAIRFAPQARCLLAVRVESEQRQGPVMHAGIYDVTQRREVCTMAIESDAAVGPDYRMLDLGLQTLTAGQYLWVGGIDGGPEGRILVDRVVLIPAR